ncbi:MAG: hypothetical protein JSV24_03495 [Bacteroidales bacterium]|nr:MAG: hypothetical protein JSV24_03495 [Bacteroidales bacterium]
MYNYCEEILRIIRRELGIINSLLSLQLNLREDLGVGSLEKARMIYALDKRFNITSDSDISDIQTVGDCVEYIEQELRKKERISL